MLSFKFLIVIFFYNTKYFNTHTHGERGDGECLKETDSGVYLKRSKMIVKKTFKMISFTN